MYRIVVTDRVAEEGLARLRAEPDFDVRSIPGAPRQEIEAALADADALIVRSGTRVDRGLLAAAPGLKVVGRAGIGVDNIDVEAATERGVVVLNTPDANAKTTAELTIAHLLSLSRHLPQADRSVREGRWERSRFIGTEVAGKTLGIVGFGTIGRIVAKRALGLEMRVLAHDPFVTEEVMRDAGVEPADLDRLLAESDYVTLHCPANEATRGLISEDRLRRMKKGARLINCARGSLVDEEALVRVLQEGHLAGAALDVYAQEPPEGSPLLGLENVVLTPHLGASTREAQSAVARAIAEQVARFLRTGEAVGAVNLPPVATEELRRAEPYARLAERLGRLLSRLAPGPMGRVQVALYGAAAAADTRAIAAGALAGILADRVDAPVNRVNAPLLARRQGIELVETRSDRARDFVSLVEVGCRVGHEPVVVAGTLLGGRDPRLVRIGSFDIEAVPEGTLLVTRHEDRPGVIGALGTLLGESGVNIARMHVGSSAEEPDAIAILSLDRPLDERALEAVRRLPPIRRVLQVVL
ncbi:MAG: phosphoglycerate dehydrogenase [Acidobacteria bacterium]|nr:MAG: phosphoglycerate dehydrogenase [Acidobacteriota bacterium]